MTATTPAKRTSTAKTVTPPPEVMTADPAPEADPFVPEFTAPTMTEDERAELDELRQRYRAEAEKMTEVERELGQQQYHDKLIEKVETSTRHVDYEETAKPPCPLCFPRGWDGVPDEHDSVGCEHGHFPRARQADRAQRLSQMFAPSGQIVGDPWDLGQDV